MSSHTSVREDSIDHVEKIQLELYWREVAYIYLSARDAYLKAEAILEYNTEFANFIKAATNFDHLPLQFLYDKIASAFRFNYHRKIITEPIIYENNSDKIIEENWIKFFYDEVDNFIDEYPTIVKNILVASLYPNSDHQKIESKIIIEELAEKNFPFIRVSRDKPLLKLDNEPAKENQATKPISPSAIWDQNIAKHALDDLLGLIDQYRTSRGFYELLKFVSKFRAYSPYNAFLVHIQMPGAIYVAPSYRWLREYGRKVKPNARPLVILQPMGPVMFVFDVSDTVPTDKAVPLPPEVENPFAVAGLEIGKELDRIIENAKRDGVRVIKAKEGAQSAGSIRITAAGISVSQSFEAGKDEDKQPIHIQIPVKFDIIVNSENQSRSTRYSTLVHELAHLYCGHLGTPNDKWWPDRRGLNVHSMEWEAETVCYLVCARAGIENPSEKYLLGHLEDKDRLPSISLECIMKAVGLIESMSRDRLKPRKEK